MTLLLPSLPGSCLCSTGWLRGRRAGGATLWALRRETYLRLVHTLLRALSPAAAQLPPPCCPLHWAAAREALSWPLFPSPSRAKACPRRGPSVFTSGLGGRFPLLPVTLTLQLMGRFVREHVGACPFLQMLSLWYWLPLSSNQFPHLKQNPRT